MYTVEQKSMLAKLMATENITVLHQKARTAKFDLKNRTLTCPVWNDMSGDMYDLLLGHEISHALHTPTQGWHDAVVGDVDEHDKKAIKKRMKFKHFLNVVEDARIERFIKDKYPGLRQPMIRAYKQLVARNFFNTANIDNFNKLYLVDKLNLAAKVGSTLNIRFSKEEQPFYDEMMRVETWEQVEDLATRLWEYSKKEQQEKKNQQADEMDEAMRQLLEESQSDYESEEDQDGDGDFDEDEDYEYDYDYEDEDEEDDKKESSKKNLKKGEEENEEEDEKGKKEQGKGDKKEEKDKEEADGKTAEKKQDKSEEDRDNNEGSSTGNGHEPNKDEDEEFLPSSNTDEAFRNNEDKLVDQTSDDPAYAYFPVPNLKDIIVPADVVNRGLAEIITRTETYAYRYNTKIITVAEKKQKALEAYHQFRDKNADYISLLVKEFEMKKAAKRYERKKIAETGDLNLAKIYNYRLEDDIFRKMLITQKGKSHGLVLVLDKSGSMQSNIKGAMEQILILASFCRKVNIPFRAFTFTNIQGGGTVHDFGNRPLKQFSTEMGDLALRHLDLREMFNSDMSDSEFTSAVINHLFLVSLFTEQIVEVPRQESMGGTPLHEALVALRDITRQFRKRHRVDIVNTVVIHDGDADWTSEVYTARHSYSSLPRTSFNPNGQRVTLMDRAEKISITLNRESRRPVTEAIMKWYQMTTGSGIFGFFISSKNPRILRSTLGEYYHNDRGTAFVDSGRTNDSDHAFVKLVEMMKEERFIESYTPGYTRLYLIAGSDDLVVDPNAGIQDNGKTWTPSRLLTAFKKVNKRKTVSRVLVSRFIGMIATEKTA